MSAPAFLALEILDHEIGHAVGQFFLTHEDLGRQFAAQQFRFLVAVRAHHRLDVRVEQARGFHHGAHVEGVGRGDHQHAGAGHVGLDQHRRLAGIAGHRVDALAAQLIDQGKVLAQALEQAAPDRVTASWGHASGINIAGHDPQ